MRRADPNGTAAWQALALAIRDLPRGRRPPDPLDEPVGRYFGHASSVDAVVPAARITMKGRIKVGRWLPFTATQLLAPRLGTVWRARVAGVITGSDRYVGGEGGMDWRLLRVVRLVHADGPDVTRSAAERAAGESIWVPTAMWPGADVRWTAVGDEEIEVAFEVDGHPVTVRHRIDHDGRLRASSFQRWGDPDSTGSWGRHPFGVEISAEHTFAGVTIPSQGRAGWHYGTERWDEGVFFTFEIVDYQLVP